MPEEEKTEQGNMPTPDRLPNGSPVGPTKSEMKPIAGGSPWLFEKTEEIDALKSPDLKPLVKILELTQPKSVDVLRQSYWEIVNLYKAGRVDLAEAKGVLEKIDERIHEAEKSQGGQADNGRLLQAAERMSEAAQVQARVARGELSLGKLPEDKDAQRNFIREFLDKIERSNRDCHDWSISMTVQRLEASLEDMKPEIAEEVKARLALHDCSELIRQANGWIERDERRVGPGLTIGSAVTTARARHHELTGEMIELLLKRGLPDLKIAQAWDELEKANFNYKELLEEINKTLPEKQRYKVDDLDKVDDFELGDDEIAVGKVAKNFFSDPNVYRKEAARQLLIKRLGGGPNAEKSLQLAEKLTIATLETSVFNRTSATGNDELAEIIGLKGWRAKRAKTGRNRGPRIHELAISGFGTSWLRFIDKDKKVDNSRSLYVRELDMDKIVKEGNHQLFCTVTIGRYQALKSLLMDREPDPKKPINKSFLQSAVVYFNTAEKEKETKKGNRSLRVLWLLGVMDMVLSNIHLGWRPRDISALGKAVAQEALSPTAGTFITKEQWDYVKKTTKLDEKLSKMELRRAVEGVIEKATS